MKQLPSGAQAPDFELKALNGQNFRLSQALRDGPVVLAFFKASCPTCQLTFPYLQTIYANARSGFAQRIWGISQDETEETEGFINRFGIEFPILRDGHPFPVSMACGLEFVPAIFIVGRNGIIQLSDYGFSKTTLAQIAGLTADDTRNTPLVLFPANDGVPERRPG